MTTEALNVVIRGRNLESLRRALAEGTVRRLQVFDKQIVMDAPDGEAVIESITLRQPEDNPAEEIEKLKTFKAALKKRGLITASG
jgi:hypothetical protein